MMRISKSVLAVGGVVLAGGLITVMNPKTVHAVTAALVQVTNTASNPVIGQNTTEQVAQLVDVDCGVSLYPNCAPVYPSSGTDGYPSYTYMPPANQSFVITAVDITSNQSCTPPTSAYLYINYGVNVVPGVHRWYLQPKSGTVHFSYPSGIVVSPQTYLTSGYDSSSCPVAYFNVYGYLTNN